MSCDKRISGNTRLSKINSFFLIREFGRINADYILYSFSVLLQSRIPLSESITGIVCSMGQFEIYVLDLQCMFKLMLAHSSPSQTTSIKADTGYKVKDAESIRKMKCSQVPKPQKAVLSSIHTLLSLC